MKKIDLGQTIGILANVGVIAGIVVLIVEINQNEESLYEDRLETSLVLFNDFREFVSQSEEMTDIWMKGMAEQEMTATSNQRFQFMCQSYLWIYATNYQRNSRQGLASAQGGINSLRRQLRESSGLRGCWDRLRDTVSDYGYPEFVRLVDSDY
jgi:hypothetical protein